MQFYITRVTDPEAKPCPEATTAYRLYRQNRSKRGVPLNWFEQGSDHREESDTHVSRIIQIPAWAIQLASLDDLKAFILREGQVIIEPPAVEGDGCLLRIYDGFCE